MFQGLHAPPIADDVVSGSLWLTPPLTVGARLSAAPNLASTKRWSLCLGLAIFFHATAAAALLGPWNAAPELVANAPVITIELATLPVAPDSKPNDVAPGPQQSEAQAVSEPMKPVDLAEPQPQREAQKALAKTVALPQGSQAEELSALAPPKSQEPAKEERPRARQMTLASAPAHTERKAPRAAAPSPGAASGDPNVMPNWKSLLVATLERNKRYPAEAEARGEYGIAELAFDVDRRGNVHHARIRHSSGSNLLDRATLAMLERAAPLPPPPAEMTGAEIPIVVPIRYSAR